MNIVDLIKQATDILSSQGNLQVDIEVNGNRYIAEGLDLQQRNSTSQQRILVVYGHKEDNYK